MKIIAFIIISFIVLLSCSNQASNSNNNVEGQTNGADKKIEQAALKQLYDKILSSSKSKNSIKLLDNELLMGDTSIKLKIEVEFSGQKEGKSIFAANFKTKLKTKQETEISVGSIGIGSSTDEAISIAIEEWIAIFGTPFSDMITNNKKLVVLDMNIYQSPMGIRGNLPNNTWLKGDDEMTKKLITSIKQSISKAGESLVAVDIKLMIGKTGVLAGECRLNNQVSTSLLDELKKLDFPTAEENFMFKQFYLVKTK